MMQTHDLFSAKELQQGGIAVAMDHANQVHDGWTDEAYTHLQNFTRTRITPFLCEEVRLYAEANGLAKPPSSRAWGGIIQRGKRDQLIKHVGFGSTSNPKAHGTPASLWVGV